MTIKFHAYASGPGQIFGTIIKVKSNSKINHVALEIEGEGIFQSTGLKGVSHMWKDDKKPVITLECPFDKRSKDGLAFIRFLNLQVGKGYDFKAVLLGFWGKKCENTDRWFCSELTDTYFSVYLKKESILKTTVSPKDFVTKVESFLHGISYSKDTAYV